MGTLPHVNSFRELIVYKKSRILAADVFELTLPLIVIILLMLKRGAY